MTNLALQISPESKSAYFAEYLDVAQAELKAVLPDLTYDLTSIGPFEFIELEAEAHQLQKLLSLSFVQGAFEVEQGSYKPLSTQTTFALHDDFVFGSKFKGKTNEHLTQMLLNVGLAMINAESGEGLKLLDPMCGRATSLIWALQYGFNAWGIERDKQAQPDIQRNLKKWCKIHRQKHKFNQGFIGGSKKSGTFIDFIANDKSLRVANGDARNADEIFTKDKFDLIASDLPYGIQHTTADNTRNPLAVLEECVEPWRNCLKKQGAIVLAFNKYNPKREAIIHVFEKQGLMAQAFECPHRMSESIVRDVVVFKHPQ